MNRTYWPIITLIAVLMGFYVWIDHEIRKGRRIETDQRYFVLTNWMAMKLEDIERLAIWKPLPPWPLERVVIDQTNSTATVEWLTKAINADFLVGTRNTRWIHIGLRSDGVLVWREKD